MSKTFIKKLPFKMLSDSPIAGTLSCKSETLDGSDSHPWGKTIIPNDELTYMTVNGRKITMSNYGADDGDEVVIYGKYRVTNLGTVLQYSKRTIDTSELSWFISITGSFQLWAYNVKGKLDNLFRLTNVEEFSCQGKNITGSVEGLAKAMVNNGRKAGTISVFGGNKSGVTVNGSTDFYSCSIEFNESYDTGYNITVKKTNDSTVTN